MPLRKTKYTWTYHGRYVIITKERKKGKSMQDAEIVKRLDRLEGKLDRALQQIPANTADIGWVKGAVKLQFGALLSLVVTSIGILIRYITTL